MKNMTKEKKLSELTNEYISFRFSPKEFAKKVVEFSRNQKCPLCEQKMTEEGK
jgi:hypothetical protein